MAGRSRLNDTLKLIVAAVKAYYGDYTGAAKEGLKRLPKIISVIAAVLFLVIMIPVMVIQSLFSGNALYGAGTGFKDSIIQCFKYEENWLEVYCLTRTRSVFTGENESYESAYNALSSNGVNEYLVNGMNEKMENDIVKIYKNNVELLENMVGSYVGFINHKVRVTAPDAYEEIYIRHNNSKRQDEVVVQMMTETELDTDGNSAENVEEENIIIEEVIFSKENITDMDIHDNEIEIEYRDYGIKAYFPIAEGFTYRFSDDFGASRIHDGKPDSHKGIDIFAKRQTPVVAIEDCKIKKIGWNGLGGWRILLKSTDGKREYYYAHLESYSDRFNKYMDMSGKVYENINVMVKTGEIVGFIGSSGSFNSSAAPGADTGTQPHLHFQIWVVSKGWFWDKRELINPYFVLNFLKSNY